MHVLPKVIKKEDHTSFERLVSVWLETERKNMFGKEHVAFTTSGSLVESADGFCLTYFGNDNEAMPATPTRIECSGNRVVVTRGYPLGFPLVFQKHAPFVCQHITPGGLMTTQVTTHSAAYERGNMDGNISLRFNMIVNGSEHAYSIVIRYDSIHKSGESILDNALRYV